MFYWVLFRTVDSYAANIYMVTFSPTNFCMGSFLCGNFSKQSIFIPELQKYGDYFFPSNLDMLNFFLIQPSCSLLFLNFNNHISNCE